MMKEIILKVISPLLSAMCLWLAIVAIFKHDSPGYIGFLFAVAYSQLLLPRDK